MKSNFCSFIFFLLLSTEVSGVYWDRSSNTSQTFYAQDILLVINYNYAWYGTVDFLKAIYGKFFPNIVFYGPEQGLKVELCEQYAGWYSYKAIGQAMEKYPGYKGYLFVHDDCFVNFWNLTRFDKGKIWICKGGHCSDMNNPSSNWVWWKRPCGLKAFKKVYQNLAEKYKSLFNSNYGEKAPERYSDIVYIPGKYSYDTIALCNLCAKYNLFLEIAVPTICSCLDSKDNFELIEGVALWGQKRKDPLLFYNTTIDYIHPLKFGSDPSLKQFVDQQVCEAMEQMS